MNKTDETKVYDVVKVIATLLVVIAHATRMYTPTGVFSPVGESYLLDQLTEYIYIFHMPLFVMISGAVYGYCVHQGKYRDSLAFLHSKARRLLIPYLAFGLLYVAPIMQFLGIDTSGYVNYSIQGILLSHNSRHLWYILALFWIFVMAMLVRPLLNRGVIGLAVAGIVSAVVYVSAGRVPGTLQLWAACQYQWFFYLGIVLHYLYAHVDYFLTRFGGLCLALPIMLVLQFYCDPNRITHMIYVGMGSLMVIALAHAIVRFRVKWLEHPLYLRLRKDSFGIYLFHPMIIYVLFWWLGGYEISPYVLSISIILISILLSIGGTWMLRKIRLGVLLGE